MNRDGSYRVPDRFGMPCFAPHPEPDRKTERSEPKAHFFTVAVDLENVNDSTAITVLEVSKTDEITYFRHKFEREFNVEKTTTELSYLVRLLHRPRLGVGWPAIIEQVQSIMADLPPMKEKPLLVVDATGLGAPVVGLMRERRLTPIGITITAGNEAKNVGRDWSVPKALLVGDLRLAMHRKLLHVAQGFHERETLANELAAFTAKLSPSGRATFAADGDAHDDAVLSLAMAVYASKHRPIAPQFIKFNLMAR